MQFLLDMLFSNMSYSNNIFHSMKNGACRIFMRKAPVQHEKYVVKVLEKAMRILDVYSRHENAFTLDDLTKRTGLDKSTVFRILRTMEKNGYIRYDQEDGLYRLGLRFMELGGVGLQLDVRQEVCLTLS